MRKIASLASLLAFAACATQPATDCAYFASKPVKGLEAVVSETSARGITLRSVCFVNNGAAPVSVDAIETSARILKGGEVWSFQPSSTGERKDWVLPVGKAFYQKNFIQEKIKINFIIYLILLIVIVNLEYLF